MSAPPPRPWSLTPDEVRSRFLSFFRARGHEEVPSDSLVPANDPTLLFTGAGMNQFKDHFLGRIPLTFRRACSSQKCLRTGDLENVGRTPGHHTFFEMLGNFSFGDYFKEEAIRWAWEFLTVEMAIPADRLRVTVYREDDEAAALWTKAAGIPADRIGRLGAKSNFWPANAPEDGPDGPCGPCSEIFFDLGFRPEPVVPCTVKGCPEAPESPDCDCRRFLEVWNLVFQQFDRRGRNDLVPLAMQNIDTGMGFERLLTVLAHLREPGRRIYSNFQTPLFGEMVRMGWDAEECLHRAAWREREERGGAEAEFRTRARRIADHARAAAFCIADGVRPSNEGRGYVLRRVIRRAVRDLIQQGFPEPYLDRYVAAAGRAMGSRYPDILSHAGSIESALRTEEEKFRETYTRGRALLDEHLVRMEAGGGTVLPGEQAFLLHDTFGFPVDVTADILAETGRTLDRPGFERAMEEARQRSREGSKIAGDIFAAGPLARVKKEETGTRFLGYGPVPEEGALLLRETPFYAEQGGQVGDAGFIESPSGRFLVRDTRRVEGFHLHVGVLERGTLRRGETVRASVDRERRDAVRRNHTGTHLLHRVLREVLGEEARQAGSLVAPDYLRFDFSFPRGLAPEERERIEAGVNRRILENHPVETRVHDLAAARATGAVSMFGEKYGDRVRVLTAGDSREFCGGTHCRATGDIGSFRILSEKSVGSGVRRIEAVTGARAVALFQEDRRRLASLEEEVERLKKEVAKAGRKAAAAAAPTAPSLEGALAAKRRVGGFELAVLDGTGAAEGDLLGAGDRVKADGGEPLVLLVHARAGEEVALVAAGNPAAVKRGFKAGAAVGVVAKALGGGGGGRPDLARGKGRDPARVPAALAALEEHLSAL
ncbi:MAG: alanine--tRNA ligase [Planctomycetes bacterium]|nr:alanine--tRNA ligase [Planctomycetota bacterium]